MVTGNLQDLDLQLRVRSSKMSVKELEEITSLVLETLTKSLKLNLVEKNLIVNTTSDKKLITITITFQSED